MSETKETNTFTYQTIKKWKIYNPNEENFVSQLFLVTIEFDKQKYLQKHPCGCDYSQNVKAHKFIKMPSGVFIKCLSQKTTIGIIPDIEKGKPYSWIKIIKKKKLTKNEARRLFSSKKFVATPDIIIFIMKNY